MIQVGQRGVTGGVGAAELTRLRSRFARRSFLRLARFFEPETLALVQDKLRGAKFRDCVDSNGVEERRQTPEDPAVGIFLWMLFSDPRVFSFIEAVTGAPPIGALLGGVYRMAPGSGHRLGWHQDYERRERRVIAMTVNLSPGPVRGGLLQFRKIGSRRLLGEAPYRRGGDAVLFRLGEDLQHRSTDIEAGEIKTIYTCWFLRRT